MGNYNYPVIGPVVKRITKPIIKPKKNPKRGGRPAIPPVLESYTLVNNGNAATAYLTVTMPSGIQAGDILIMWSGISHTSGLGGSNHGTVSGWDRVEQLPGATSAFAWYWRVATGSEAASYDIPWTTTAKRQKGGCIRVSGCDTTQPWHAFDSNLGASGASYEAPALANSYEASLPLIVGGGSYNNAAGGTYTESDSDWAFTEQQASSYGNAYLAEVQGGGPASNPSPAFTMTNASSWAGYWSLHLLLRPPQ